MALLVSPSGPDCGEWLSLNTRTVNFPAVSLSAVAAQPSGNGSRFGNCWRDGLGGCLAAVERRFPQLRILSFFLKFPISHFCSFWFLALRAGNVAQLRASLPHIA